MPENFESTAEETLRAFGEASRGNARPSHCRAARSLVSLGREGQIVEDSMKELRARARYTLKA